MASASRKIQSKLFGNSNGVAETNSGEKLVDPFLTINIPNRHDSPTGQTTKSYREHLLNKLGTKYEGVERYRLDQDDARERHWKRWGPYLAERQWATVREDYSSNGDAWSHFPHDHARSRVYRWGEDGLAGISDNHQRLCFALSLWNGEDDILKERLFGVTGHEGNHGEDCKELYYYLDSTPTHSYMKFLYKYPQTKYPYDELVKQSKNRGRDVVEYELIDTGILDEDRYWDIFVEYAKDADDPDAISVRITAYNRGPDPADLHILPTLWFRNTWDWVDPQPKKPVLRESRPNVISATHPTLGKTRLYCMGSPSPIGPDGVYQDEDLVVEPELVFTENETNFRRLWGGKNSSLYTKDAFHDYVIPGHRGSRKGPPVQAPTVEPEPELKPSTSNDSANGSANVSAAGFSRSSVQDSTLLSHSISSSSNLTANTTCSSVSSTYSDLAPEMVNPEKTGTKAAAHYHFPQVPGNGGCVVVRLKLTPSSASNDSTLTDDEAFDNEIEARLQDANEFYARLGAGPISPDLASVMRQALGGMMWSKQWYHFVQTQWIEGDPTQPPPPPERKWIRNKEWRHLHINDVLSMPDKWEYPFFAAWDTAFHCIPLAMIDPSFAKKQLDLLTREWYMKPDGQIPAYEWNFSDVNPPVHAWATFRVFKIERKMYGREDLQFLERVFQKLLLNFTWWVNRKDSGGNNVFEGGFLGLDNIGAFNRSEPLPTGGVLRQADGTAWMAFFALNMLNMALELAKHNPVYEDIASKFFEHFIFIADAMTFKGSDDMQLSLWNDEEGMYFDAIQFGPGHSMQMPVRSLVGLIPLYATLTLEPSVVNRLPGFKKRLEWFIENRPTMAARNMANMKARGKGDRILLALASKERLVRILEKMLDENEFLSEHGIRSLSLYHKDRPYHMDVNGQRYEVGYWPGDSHSGMFGGNSNWRGPIWLAVNFLLIESLQRFHQYYGEDLQVECPTGSGEYMNLAQVAEEIQHRIIHIFGRDEDGQRSFNGGNRKMNNDPHFRDYIQFYEYFHGNDGRGLGASHQTGWTGLVAFHIMQSGLSCRLPRTPRTPRSLAKHYFDENIDTHSEYGTETPFSAYSARSEAHSLGDLSPDAL